MGMPAVCVIMAGGTGERFWPVSRRLRPKQLLRLTSDDRNMLEESVERIARLLPRENIFIATSAALRGVIAEALPNHPERNIIGEPMRRNTSGCLALAAAQVRARFEGEDVLMAVTTADHLIGEEDRFAQTVNAALRFAEENDALVTIGAHPTRPETGYGYIEIAGLNKPIRDDDGVPVYKVARFLEKPNLEDAERYQASRFYYWNSGMFFWRTSVFIESLSQAQPVFAEGISAMTAALKKTPRDDEAIERVFETFPDISIDYALMEKADNVYVALGDFRWDDIGAWDSLARIRPRDDERNAAVGDPVLIDCANTVVYNERGADEMAVCVIGMDEIIVVTTHDAVLICPRDRAQDVRKAVEELKKRGASQL
ncbi:MAG: hypothetical protein GC154_01110 [bacterium]|nr:hypothetical protein [bacterium]